MEDDILDSYLTSKEQPFAQPAEEASDQPKSYPPKKNTDRIWDSTDIKRVKPDPSKFVKEGKSYMVMTSTTPPADVVEILNKLITSLATKNFTLRYQFDSLISFTKDLSNRENITKEIYLPWKRMAPDLENAHMVYPNRSAYEFGVYYAKKFLSFPPAVRALRAMTIHTLLGKKCNNPVDFVILWSENGEEKLREDSDFKKLGNLPNVFSVCSDLNIPMFNIGNKESLTKLVEKIKAL